MAKPNFNPSAAITTKKIDLHELVNLLVKALLPSAVSHNSLIVNDIPIHTYLSTDEDLISIVLSNLLLNTVSSSQNSCIRISAANEDDETLITVKDNNSDYSRYISGKMTKVQPIVKKMGGDLRFEFNQRNSITILLSFAHKNIAA